LRIEIGGADIESPFHGSQKKGDGQLEVSKSPALPKSDKEQNRNPAMAQKVFTMDRIWCSRWAGFGVHDGPDSAFTMARKMQQPTTVCFNCI
jgi:hypothetical protein